MQNNNFSSLTSEDFKNKLTLGEYILIDIRTSQEQEIYGVIAHEQIHIDISQPSAVEKIQKLDNKKKYLLYCWHGVRSKQVLLSMQQSGFYEAYDLEGGIDKWNI